MANNLKCYSCGKNETSDSHYYCYDCLKLLKHYFDMNENIITNAKHTDHCVSCGQFENRRIVLMYGIIPICDACVRAELENI